MEKKEARLIISLLFIFLFSGLVFFFFERKQPAKEGGKKEISVNKGSQLTVSSEKGFGDLKKIMSQENNPGQAKQTSSSALDGRGGGGVAMEKMIYPGPFVEDYQLVYVGGDFDLPTGTVDVLKRKKGKKEGGDVLWENLFQNFAKMAKLELSSFENLTVSNLNFYEDKEFGLNFSLDLENSSAYIGPQWDKWQNISQQCGADQACYEANRLTKKDWLSDEEFLKIADDFLEKIGISKADYESGQIEKRAGIYPLMSKSSDTKSVSGEDSVSAPEEFVPEIATVFYQQKINQQKVFDLSGNQEGLRVEVDVRQKKVRGASPISGMEFFVSAYPVETAQKRIVEIAENGGWKRGEERLLLEAQSSDKKSDDYQEPEYPFEEKTKKKEVKLGKPELGLVKVWDYSAGNGRNEELFIPSFIFPVLDQAENFWPKNIIVPAVKEE